MTISVKIDSREFDKLMLQSRQVADGVAEDSYRHFRDITPHRSGNAQRNTHYTKSSKTITADYAYAQRLDEGWSKQAVHGMVQPTIDYLDRLVEQELRKL